MNGEQTNICVEDPKQGRLPGGYLLAAVGALALVVCCLAINNESFWVDEAVSVLKAKEPTLARFWRALDGSPEIQQPFFFLFARAWEKLVGLNECAMRAGNAPWFLAGSIILFCAVEGKPLLRWSLLAVFLSSPFAWYYLNEVRPYAMEIALSLVVFAALYRLGLNQKASTQERGWVITLCLGSLLLSATSILAMLFLGAYLGAAVFSTPKEHRRRLARDYRVYWGLTLPLLFALGLFYLWTLSIGSHGGYAYTTDIKTVLFVAYELLGFDGLGPGRLAIRNEGLVAFWPWLPWLAIYSVVLLIVLKQGWKQIAVFTSVRTRIFWVVALAIVGGFIEGTGAKVGWRALARHCTPLLIPVLFVLGAGVAALLSRKNWAGRVAAVAFVGLNVASDMNLRFSQRHAKDDCRTAAAVAIAAVARGERVWWCADRAAGIYYGVPLSQRNNVAGPDQVWHVENPPEHLLDNQPPPQLVVLLSKSGYSDKENRVRAYLEQNRYRLSEVLPAFTVWRRGDR